MYDIADSNNRQAIVFNPSAAAFTAILPCLGCSDTTLTDMLTPDHIRNSNHDGHHPEAAHTVAPHPDVHLVESAAFAFILS
jgi:hypothetical protein